MSNSDFFHLAEVVDIELVDGQWLHIEDISQFAVDA